MRTDRTSRCARRFAGAAFWLGSLTFLFGWAGIARADDHAFLDQLLQRRLSRLGETFCREQLADSTLMGRERALWTVDLIRCQLESALLAAPANREPLWRQARGTAADFLREPGNQPYRGLVQFQDALTVLSQGELARLELEPTAASGSGQSVARDLLREAILLLEALERDLGGQIPEARRHAPGREGLGTKELMSLQYHCWHQLVRARRNQALCYAEGSPDRLASASQAIDFSRKVLAQVPLHEPLAVDIRVEQAECQQLVGDLSAARAALAPLSDIELSSVQATRMVITAARIEMAAGRTDTAARLLAGVTPPPVGEAEYGLAQLELLLAQWRAEARRSGPSVSKKWQSNAVRLVAELEARQGPYWGRQAERLLLAATSELGAQADWDLVRRSAEQLFLQGQFPQAVSAYELAAAKALADGAAEAAFDLGLKAALIQQQQSQHDDAQRRLRTLSTEHRDLPRAGQVHLLAAWNLAQLAPDNAMRRGEYRRVLEEHLEFWPDDASSSTARVWLGNLLRQDRRWRQAIAAYRGVPADFADFEACVDGVLVGYEQLLREESPEGSKPDELLREALAYCESIYTSEGAFPDRWTKPQLAAGLAAARLQAAWGRVGFGRYLDVLNAMPRDAASDDQPSRREAALLGVVLAAAQMETIGAAHAAFDRLEQLSPDEALRLLVLLERFLPRAAPSHREALGHLILAVLEQSAPSDGEAVSELESRRETIRGEALAATGRLTEAISVYARLASSQIDDGRIQERYGELLSQSLDPAVLAQALNQWRRVTARSEPGSDRWLRAKYAVADTLFRLNQRNEASQLIRYLLATGALDDSHRKSQFQELLGRCN